MRPYGDTSLLGPEILYLLIMICIAWRALQRCNTLEEELREEKRPVHRDKMVEEDDNGRPPFLDFTENGRRRVVRRGDPAYDAIWNNLGS